MNLPPIDINVDAARLNEIGASSHQENQAINQTLKTQEVRGDIANNQSISSLPEAAKTAALRARQEEHQMATLDQYYVAEIKKASGLNAANSGSNELAMFAKANPEALRALLS